MKKRSTHYTISEAYDTSSSSKFLRGQPRETDVSEGAKTTEELIHRYSELAARKKREAGVQLDFRAARQLGFGRKNPFSGTKTEVSTHFPALELSTSATKTKPSLASPRLSTAYESFAAVGPRSLKNARSVNSMLREGSKQKMREIVERTGSLSKHRQEYPADPTRDISNLFEKKSESRPRGPSGIRLPGEELVRTLYREADRPPTIAKASEFRVSNSEDLSSTQTNFGRSLKPLPRDPASDGKPQPDPLEHLHTTDFFKLSLTFPFLQVDNSTLLLDLFRELPHCLQNFPSNKQETLQLRQWFLAGYQQARSLSDREEYCKLALLETLRQVFVNYCERGHLLMEVIQRYHSIQHEKVQAALDNASSLRQEFDNRFEVARSVFEKTINRNLDLMQAIQTKLNASELRLKAAEEKLGHLQGIEAK